MGGTYAPPIVANTTTEIRGCSQYHPCKPQTALAQSNNKKRLCVWCAASNRTKKKQASVILAAISISIHLIGNPGICPGYPVTTTDRARSFNDRRPRTSGRRGKGRGARRPKGQVARSSPSLPLRRTRRFARIWTRSSKRLLGSKREGLALPR